jgi:hypothetical protein
VASTPEGAAGTVPDVPGGAGLWMVWFSTCITGALRPLASDFSSRHWELVSTASGLVEELTAIVIPGGSTPPPSRPLYLA